MISNCYSILIIVIACSTEASLQRCRQKGNQVDRQWNIFGRAENLWHRTLPSYDGVMKYYLFVRMSMKQKNNKDPATSEIIDQIERNLE